MAKLYVPHQGKLLELEIDPNKGIDNIRILGHIVILSLVASTLNVMSQASAKGIRTPKLVLGRPADETKNLLYQTLLVLRKGDADRVEIDLAEDRKIRREVVFTDKLLFELGYYSLNDLLVPPLRSLG